MNTGCILLAEDDRAMRNMLAWTLKKRGYVVIECSNGMDLMKHLGVFDAPADLERIGLIVCDVRMPHRTGISVLEAAERHVTLPPVILITAFPDQENVKKAAHLGAAALLAKPFDIDEFLTTVDRVLEAAKGGTTHEKKTD